MVPLIKHHSLRTGINSLSTSSGSLIKLWQGGAEGDPGSGAALRNLCCAFCKITLFAIDHVFLGVAAPSRPRDKNVCH